MKQIQFESFGQPSMVARCVDVDDVGAPSPWEVVVDVEAFPINVADLAMLAGRYGTMPKPPATIGMEAVGRVSLCGSSVRNIHVGDRVVLLANNNWAERRKVPAAAVHPIRNDADVNQVAMLKVNPATAHLLIHHVTKLQPGDWLIQTAPLSSVGQCVIQIAKRCGIQTINIVRRADAVADVLKHGGDVAILAGEDLPDRLRSAIGHAPVNVALDAVAGSGTQTLAECLSEGGQIINYGMLSAEPCSISPEQTIFRNISLQGFWLSKILNRLSHRERTELFDSLCDLVHAGELKIDIDSIYAIQDIRTALARAEQPGRSGKVVVATSHQKGPVAMWRSAGQASPVQKSSDASCVTKGLGS